MKILKVFFFALIITITAFVLIGFSQEHKKESTLQEKTITEGCRKINLNIKVARLQSPVPEISSSKIEKEYGEAIHDL